METLKKKVARVLKDRIELVPYDPAWPGRFEEEKAHLLACLPEDLVGRIEHYGSTSIPGMTAKPVVDMLVEVTSHELADKLVPSILEPQGYDYFWRPLDDTHYPWLIKRDESGRRTHHVHMAESGFRLWEGLVFRDYLLAHPDAAEEYRQLKFDLVARYADDRVAYTEAKAEFVNAVLGRAERGA